MANTNTDLTEEDAADLQFPKGRFDPFREHAPPTLGLVVAGHFSPRFPDDLFSAPEPEQLDAPPFPDLPDVDNLSCGGCRARLSSPYLLCSACEAHLCPACFAVGAEFAAHSNDHPYRVIRDDFQLFHDSDWTAREETTLLESVLKLGNWGLVARKLPGRTEQDCKAHYQRFYLDGRGSNHLPRIKETAASLFPQPRVPYRFRIPNTEDPPRYQTHHVGYYALSGYNAARSDFEVEYDRSAEALLSGLQEIDPAHPHYEALTKLQCGIVNIYNRRLEQRKHRRRIVRNHGLISYRKTAGWLHRYDTTITRPVYSRLMRFMPFCTGEGLESLMEGLHRSGELKLRIFRLCSYRSKGITTLADAKLYHNLQELREKLKKELKTFQNDSRLSWRGVAPTAILPSMPGQKRRSGYTPLEIIGLPGYEKLSPKERELCKNVRLVPISYIEFKNTLITESRKMGYLKLQNARKLLKIDVNKTRRLYDFLIEEGYIEKSPN